MSRTALIGPNAADILRVCTDLPPDEIEQIEAFTGRPFDPVAIAESMLKQAWLHGLVDAESDEILVVGCLYLITPSTYRTCFLATNRAWQEYGKEVTLASVDMLAKVLATHRHARFETLCLAKRTLAQRWYEMIGLKLESTLPEYGANGEDAVLYVKTNRR